MMKILHFAPVSKDKASGISFSVPNLIKGQNLSIGSTGGSELFNIRDAKRLEKGLLKEYDVIAFHSFFHPIYIRALLKIPQKARIIVCPRGAFSSKNHFDLKKRLYSSLFFFILRLKTKNWSIHFLTKNERKISRYGGKNDFVLGNCIETSGNIENIELKRKFEAKTIVYVGRFSNHIKGLDLLFDFFVKYQIEMKELGYRVNLFGPESSDKDVLKKRKQENQLDFVEFFPAVFTDEKEKVFKSSTFHILNSRSEGYPMAVLETMKFHTPQILSKGTNLLEDLEEWNFGFEFDRNLIESLSRLDFHAYNKLTQNVKNYVELHDCEVIGERSLAFYK